MSKALLLFDVFVCGECNKRDTAYGSCSLYIYMYEHALSDQK